MNFSIMDEIIPYISKINWSRDLLEVIIPRSFQDLECCKEDDPKNKF
jgi:hypothetical protein